MTSQLMQNKDLGVLLVPQMLVTPFCKQFDNNFDKLWRDIRHFVPGWPNIAGDASPGIPGGVDAYDSLQSRLAVRSRQ